MFKKNLCTGKRSIVHYFVLGYVGFNTTLVLCKRVYLRYVRQSFSIMNRHQKDMCYNEIGLRPENEDTVIGSQLGGPT